MKKTLCLIFSILFVLSFAGCKIRNKEEDRPTLDTDASGVDIIKYAKKGKIPELKYALGDDADAIIAALEDDEDEAFSIMDGDEYTTIITPDNANLVFETDSKEKKIKYIVSFGKSYGFENEVDPNTVSEVMDKKGYSAKLSSIPEKLMQFVPASANCDCLSYTVSGYSLNFVFDNNYLAATILYKKG